MNTKPMTWAEIDLDALAHNIRELRRICNPDSRLMIAVKANAYGHGIIETARCGLENGADSLGVARIDEGIRLRKAGIKAPILVFGYSPIERSKDLIEFDLTQTVYSLETAKAISSKAKHAEKKIKVHFKADTGMGRLGMVHDQLITPQSKIEERDRLVQVIKNISKQAGLSLEGIFTHFAASDSADKTYTNNQFSLFMDLNQKLKKAGVEIPLRHAANSGAIIDMPHTHLDMVRAGISVYGLYPSDEVNKKDIKLKPVMSLKARIIHLKKVPAGFKVSYGMTYQTEKTTQIATVPVGYADGYNRLLSSRGHMLVRGQKVPVTGRVCMDLTMLDVGNVPDVNMEDEVVVFGKQGDLSITVDEIASSLNTINYEIVTSITQRVPRIYLKPKI